MIGNFGAVDLDDGVVDPEAAQRRQHMFGRRDGRAAMIAQHGGEFSRRDGTEVGA